MLMNVYEYNVSVKGECVAGFDDLDDAKAFARHTANEKHCSVEVINAFTGEVHLILSVTLTIDYTINCNSELEEIRRTYTVTEGWEV